MTRHRPILLTVAGLLLPATAALAHPGDGLHASALPGLLHPLSGLDHLAALLAVGAWSSTQRGAVRWLIPGSFLIVMATGAQWAGGSSPAIVEGLIAGSLLVLGTLLAAAFRLPAMPAILISGAFAFFHGYAHGAELPVGGAMVPFTAGFALSSALLLAAGHAAGRGLAGTRWLRGAGVVLALSGIVLFA